MKGIILAIIISLFVICSVSAWDANPVYDPFGVIWNSLGSINNRVTELQEQWYDFQETDPQVNTLSNGKWCTTDGSAVNCLTNAPVTTETDPQVGTLSNGKWCITDGSTVNCLENAPVTAETDPRVGILSATKWCRSDGSVVNCNNDLPLESDPQVGSLSNGKWCTTDGSAVNCLTNAPVTTETDPQVGTLTATKWCRSDGSTVSCNYDLPSENDPTIGTLASGMWCTSDGSIVNCVTSPPVLTETDPQVGTMVTNYIPRWGGIALAAGTIYDNGNIGIGTSSPTDKLEVVGDIRASKNDGELVLRTPNRNDAGRYRIRFENNILAPFVGDDTQEQIFAFYTNWSAKRKYDAHINIYGRAAPSWGNYLGLTHNGTAGIINTDVGNIVIDAAGDLTVKDVIQLKPTDSPGTCTAARQGAVYYDLSLNEPCYCTGTGWRQFDTNTAC